MKSGPDSPGPSPTERADGPEGSAEEQGGGCVRLQAQLSHAPLETGDLEKPQDRDQENKLFEGEQLGTARGERHARAAHESH